MVKEKGGNFRSHCDVASSLPSPSPSQSLSELPLLPLSECCCLPALSLPQLLSLPTMPMHEKQEFADPDFNAFKLCWVGLGFVGRNEVHLSLQKSDTTRSTVIRRHHDCLFRVSAVYSAWKVCIVVCSLDVKARGHPQTARRVAGEQRVRHAAWNGALEELPNSIQRYSRCDGEGYSILRCRTLPAGH